MKIALLGLLTGTAMALVFTGIASIILLAEAGHLFFAAMVLPVGGFLVGGIMHLIEEVN
jgi:hypothetical protein